MRIIFLNRFYWPDEPATAQLLTDLSGALATAGHDVTVIASRPGWTPVPLRESRRGVTIARVTSTRWSQHGLLGKTVDFITFSLSALVKLALIARRGDNIVVLTDPPLIGIGAWFVAQLSGARVFHWVQDVYPEIAVVLSGQTWLRVFQPLRNLAWRMSDGCVVLGTTMASRLARCHVPPEKTTIIPNWAPEGLTTQTRAAADPLRTAWRLENKFIVAYSGNLGRVHDLAPVVEVAAALRDEPNIAFVFIGGGAQLASLKSRVAELGLDHVHFHSAQPRAHLAVSLALGDLHLVTLLPGCEALVFPSKLYGIAAVGRPVLYIGPSDSDVAQLVADRGIGRAFARAEIAPIAGFIRELQTDPLRWQTLAGAAEDFGRAHAGPDAAARAWVQVLTKTD